MLPILGNETLIISKVEALSLTDMNALLNLSIINKAHEAENNKPFPFSRYLNVLFVMRANGIYWCLMAFKVKKLPSRQFPYLF